MNVGSMNELDCLKAIVQLTESQASTLGNAVLFTNQSLSAGQKSQARSNLGLGTMATQNANAVAITGGTINGTVIGGSTPAAGTFTGVTLTSGGAALSLPSNQTAIFIDGATVFLQFDTGGGGTWYLGYGPTAMVLRVNGANGLVLNTTAATFNVPVEAPSYKVNGIQVLGAQQTTPADATTSHSLPGSDTVNLAALEAALNALGTGQNQILDVLQAHGAIG